jgi:plasmid stabilization system protein ParE
MIIKWTPSARKSLKQIQSIHFTQEETKRYQINLVRAIEQKIAVLLEAMPANEPSWQGTYRILVDKYKVYYSFSEDKRTCYIEALRHQHQQTE